MKKFWSTYTHIFQGLKKKTFLAKIKKSFSKRNKCCSGAIVLVKGRHDIQHKDIQLNGLIFDAQHKLHSA